MQNFEHTELCIHSPLYSFLIAFNPSTCVVPADLLLLTYTQTDSSRMRNFSAITVHPDIQDGAPVFSGTRIRIETFCDFIRIGVSVSEFLDEFPSITRDQALEVYDLVKNQYTIDQIKSLVDGPQTLLEPGMNRLQAAA